MKLLKAKADNQKKIILEISKIHYIKSMTPLPELLNGEDMQNPVEVRQHTYSLTPRKGTQTQKMPPITSVKDKSVSSAAGICFDPIEYKIKPRQTKVP